MFKLFKITPIKIVLFFLILSVMSCAGYCNRGVEENEVGIKMDDGVAINKEGGVVYAGRYSKVQLYPEPKLVIIDVGAKTNRWSDLDMVSQDKQQIGIELSVTYARKRDIISITNMYRQWNSEALDDAALWIQVSSRVPGIVKAITVNYSLDEMLGIATDSAAANSDALVGADVIAAAEIGRTKIRDDIITLLEPELGQFGTILLNLEIVNIIPDEEYMNALQQKALAIINKEVAIEETSLLREQLNQEKAQTEIELERARRDNLVNEELAKVYTNSPEYLSLVMLQTWADTLDETDQIIFIPSGSPLSVFLDGANGNVVSPSAAAAATINPAVPPQ